MTTDFWAAIAAALNNRSSLVWILAILALLTWVAWHTHETLLLIFLRLVLGTGRFLFVGLTQPKSHHRAVTADAT